MRKKLLNFLYSLHDEIATSIITPSIIPTSLYQNTGRDKLFRSEIFSLKDRHDRLYSLSCTAEELISFIFSNRIHSIRRLPHTVYQLTEKFRDEIRPRAQIVRARSFEMIDSYALTASDESTAKIYDSFYQMYNRIFAALEIDVYTVTVDDDTMLSHRNHEFICTNSSYAEAQEGDRRGVEIGHIFDLGDRYTKAIDYRLKNSSNIDIYPKLSSYGIGVSRLMALLIEKLFVYEILPSIVRPFHAVFVPRAINDTLYEYAERLSHKYDILIDDDYRSRYIDRLKFVTSLGAKWVVYEDEHRLHMLKNNDSMSTYKENLEQISFELTNFEKCAEMLSCS